jgi:hypothetical protein
MQSLEFYYIPKNRYFKQLVVSISNIGADVAITANYQQVGAN